MAYSGTPSDPGLCMFQTYVFSILPSLFGGGPQRLWFGKSFPRSQEGLTVCFLELSGACCGDWVLAGVAELGATGHSWWMVWAGGGAQIPCFQRWVSKPWSALFAFSEDERNWMRRVEACPELKPGAGLVSPGHLHVHFPPELSGQHYLRPSVPR